MQNRQHTTIISMNNRLVKEYVRAVRELKPKAFVMENVAMLKSNIHRFMVEETDINDPVIMGLTLSEDKIELLPKGINFPDAVSFAKDPSNIKTYMGTKKKSKQSPSYTAFASMNLSFPALWSAIESTSPNYWQILLRPMMTIGYGRKNVKWHTCCLPICMGE